jgi:hypothetical protein
LARCSKSNVRPTPERSSVAPLRFGSGVVRDPYPYAEGENIWINAGYPYTAGPAGRSCPGRSCATA